MNSLTVNSLLAAFSFIVCMPAYAQDDWELTAVDAKTSPAEKPQVTPAQRKLLRCLRKLTHKKAPPTAYDQFRSAIYQLQQGATTEAALASCRSGYVSEHLPDPTADAPVFTAYHAMKERTLTDCKGIALNGGGAILIAVSAHAVGMTCKTSDYRSALILAAGAGFGGGLGAGVTVQKVDAQNKGEVYTYQIAVKNIESPLVVGQFNQATYGYGVMTAEDHFENMFAENAPSSEWWNEAIRNPRGAGIGGFSTWGVNAGLRALRFTRADDVARFERDFGVRLSR